MIVGAPAKPAFGLGGDVQASAAAQPSQPTSAVQLYRDLRTVGLDPQRVYRVRELTLDRGAIHLTFSDGVIAFTRAVDGRITGAFFEGEGDVLLSPSTQVERSSLALFSGAAILEERFNTAYLRFNDNTFDELKPRLRPPTPKSEDPADKTAEKDEKPDEDPATFASRFELVARNLADNDALRLLESFTTAGTSPRLLHARLGGVHLGAIDVYDDEELTEPISIAQATRNERGVFYDVWTSFAPPNQPPRPEGLHIPRYAIRAAVRPPHDLEASTELELEGGWRGRRVIFFELSRFLKLTRVTLSTAAGETPLEFLQNEAIEGTERARLSNDLVAVIFPQAPADGAKQHLTFTYSGPVMSEAGGGLLYVGAKGTWYPNRGPDMSRFDIQFRYPQNWTLVATGKRLSENVSGGEQIARWVAEQPVPLAGFNVGQYDRVSAKVGDVNVAVYATRGVESSFPTARAADPVLQPPLFPGPTTRRPQISALPPMPLDPAAHARGVAQHSARALEWFMHRLGAFPYDSLSLAQMPGRISQSWPGLIYLSSYAFMTNDERLARRLAPLDLTFYGRIMPAHETAHQWFGDSVLWQTYRDQWIMEALANYSALLFLEQEDPNQFRAQLEDYRQRLLRKEQGQETRAAGPVTLGARLSSSKFPGGYEDIVYGRGTWLLHMLRSLLRDSGETTPRTRAARATVAGTSSSDPDAAFFQVLRKLLTAQRYKSVSTQQVIEAFAAALPPSARFEGRASLEWFLDGWVNGAAMPAFELKDVKLAPRGERVQVSGRVLQKDAPSSLISCVPVYAVTTSKPIYLGRVFADGEETSFRFTAPAGTKRLVLDPYGTVLSRGEKRAEKASPETP
jgi:hypothetical protein